MEYVTLGRTGLRVSRLAIGTNELSRRYDPEVTPRVMNWLLDQGLNYIGTGNMYGDCQTYLRRSIMHRRDEFYLSSKGGIVPARDILLGIEAALYWLGTDHLDVWEMDCVRSMDSYEVAFGPGGTLEGIKKAQEQGKVRFIGVSSHCPAYANAWIDSGEVDTAMFFVNPVFAYGVREILPHARAQNVGTLGMRPTDHALIRPIDGSLMWALHSGVDVVISGMYTMEEARQNVALAEARPSEGELTALRERFAAVPEHGCRNCFACKCPFNIPVQQFATYLAWREAFGLSEELEATLRTQARRAADFVAFCDACGLCEAQCRYGVPLVAFVKRAVQEFA